MFFKFKKDNLGNHKYVFVYYYGEDGKQHQLPRKLTKHLDGEPETNIKFWIDEYLRKQGLAKVVPNPEITQGKIQRLVETYCTFLRGRSKSEKTVKQQKLCLLRHALPYFVHINEDPNYWPKHSIRLLAYLEGKQISSSTIRVTNVALRGFWKYIVEEGHVLSENGLLKLRNPVIKRRKETPLQKILQPKDVLDYIKEARSHELKLMAALGYFFSLRPQETFALTYKDFRAGSTISGLECIKTMTKLGLYNKLAVNITKQKTDNGEVSIPKQDSKGWVACFEEEAAKLIVESLKNFGLQIKLFSYHNRTYFKLWEKEGIKNVSLKDLRRASLYWLGHNTNIQPVELMKHARHADFETTTLYLRRPSEKAEESDNFFDLEA